MGEGGVCGTNKPQCLWLSDMCQKKN
uniref:Uncharacterized protein n=1 Tax=Arundo donax TaxID=35708 RepID=A0A0A8XR75_ARUDO